jgi:hypothetical protein
LANAACAVIPEETGGPYPIAANRIKTSQFGFPTAALAQAYAAGGYATSVRNLAS